MSLTPPQWVQKQRRIFKADLLALVDELQAVNDNTRQCERPINAGCVQDVIDKLRARIEAG